MKKIFKSFFSSTSETDEEKQVKNEAKNFDILKFDGLRAQQMGKWEYAIKCYTEALKLRKDIDTMASLVVAYTTRNKITQALELTNEMVDLAPERMDVHMIRVNTLFLLNDYVEVITACEKMISLEAENAMLFFLMARAKRILNKEEEAIANLSKAIELKDEFTEAFLMRGQIYYCLEQVEEALVDANKCIELLPEEEEAYLLRGQIEEKLGNIAAARADYQHVLTLNPFHEEANIRTGCLLIKENYIDEAVAFFDEMIEILPECALAYTCRSKAKQQKGDVEGAEKDQEKAKNLQDVHCQETQEADFSTHDTPKATIFWTL